MENKNLTPLTKENYKSNHDYMSYSRFKTFLHCEAAAFSFQNPPSTTALLVSSYIDAYFSKELDDFKLEHLEIFNIKTGELKSDFKSAQTVIDRIERDELLMHYMSGEPQAIMSGEINGVLFKIKMDSYLKDEAIVDLKVMKDFNKVWSDLFGGYTNFVEAYDYDLELAIFQEVVYQNTGKKLPCYLVCATKEEHPDIGLFEIPQETLDKALQFVYNNLSRYKQIAKGEVAPHRCEKCAYCKDTKKAKIINYEFAGYDGDKLREEGIECDDIEIQNKLKKY